MTIKAVLRRGIIQPVEPLPSDWADGQELVVEAPRSSRDEAEIARWAQELDTATAQLPAEEHTRFQKALGEIEKESKEAVRRQWEQP